MPWISEEKVCILKPKFVTVKLNYNVQKNGDLELRFTLYKMSISGRPMLMFFLKVDTLAGL